MKKLLLMFAVVGMLGLPVFAPIADADTPKAPAKEQLSPTEKDVQIQKISYIVARLMMNMHYLQTPINDSISNFWFDDYFNTLDPNHMFFFQHEIDSWREKYRNRLDDLMLKKRGDISFAYLVFDKMKSRIDNYTHYSLETLNTPQDFTTDETINIDRSRAVWPKDEAEMKSLWKKRIRNELLSFKLVERANIELGDKAKKDSESVAWKKANDIDRLKKRIQQFGKNYENLTHEDVAELYLSSMMHAYDPHSMYMAPSTEDDFNIQMGLELIGIGAELISEDGYIKITGIVPGGPAAKSGELNVNDRIIAVAEEGKEPTDLLDMSINKAVTFIRGAKGSKITLTILESMGGPTAQPKNITLMREKIELKDAEAKGEVRSLKLPNQKELKVGIIVLPSFYRNFAKDGTKCCYDDVRKIILDFNKQNVQAMILDLRSNGGGALLDAIQISGLFIRKGPVVQIKSANGDITPGDDTNSEMIFKGPLIVMTNKLSASASEILAGAMQDYHRAIIVGDQQTHGKGTVQEVRELDVLAQTFRIKPPLGAIKFTTAKFYRINGETTQIRGVVPNIIFPAFTDVISSGESEFKSALPFDTIPPLPHDFYMDNYKDIAQKLAQKSYQRTNQNNLFKMLEEHIAYLKKIKNQKTISLNINKRWEEYKKEKEIMERQIELLKLSKSDKNALGVNKKDANNNDKPKDIYLNETLEIMKDLWELTQGKDAA